MDFTFSRLPIQGVEVLGSASNLFAGETSQLASPLIRRKDRDALIVSTGNFLRVKKRVHICDQIFNSTLSASELAANPALIDRARILLDDLSGFLALYTGVKTDFLPR